MTIFVRSSQVSFLFQTTSIEFFLGLPRRNGFSHAKVIGNLAIALLEKTKSFTIRHRPNDQLRIRIGINSGPVTAGIVGSKMPQYCVFGDTVNTGALQIISPQKDSQHQLVVNLASRMESSGVPMKIQVAHNTFELLVKHYPNEFRLTYRGEAEVKVDLILLVEILNQFAGWMAFREKD